MKKVAILLIAVSMFLVLIQVNAEPVQASARSDLNIVFYPDENTAWTALVNDQVDVVDFPASLTGAQRDAVEADPNLQLAAHDEWNVFQFDLNNDAEIIDYPGRKSPMSDEKVRAALCSLVDKDYIVSNILDYFGTRVDAPVAAPSYWGWVNQSMVTWDWNGNGIIEPSEDKYPWNYNVTRTVDLLAVVGFRDSDADGYLNYPADWPGFPSGKTQDMPLKICIRSDDSHRLAAGRYLVAQLEGDPTVAGDSVLALSPEWARLGVAGGDFDTSDILWQKPRSVLSPIVMGDHNFHIYTGGWSFGRFSYMYIYSLYDEMFHYSYGSNYIGAHLPEWPPPGYIGIPENIADAQNWTKFVTGYIIEHAINMLLWSYRDYAAWRKEVAGVVNVKGYGIVNDYTFMNAYRTTNPSAPLRVGAVSGWERLNVLYSQWYFEYLMIDRASMSMINANPYDLGSDIPWAAQDWEVGTWVDGRDGQTKTTVTYWLRKNVGGAAPVTGGSVGNFTALDYRFSAWYNYAFDDSWQWGSWMDINHIELIDDYTAKVYFDDQLGIWFLYAPVYPFLGPATTLEPLLCEDATATIGYANFTSGSSAGYYEADLVGGTPAAINSVVRVVSATKNGAPITEGVDFYVRSGYDVFSRTVFVPIGWVPVADDTITVNYKKAVADGAKGTYLGGMLGLDWTDTMYSYGYLYPVSITATSATMKRNPYYCLETPPLGEIDWRWNSIEGAKPRSGFFRVDILDVVKVTGAYSSRGDGLYSAAYFAGADIDGSDLCHVGILDLVTVTGQYAATWGTPPA